MNEGRSKGPMDSGGVGRVRLAWTTWQDVCELLGDAFRRGALGVYVDPEGRETDDTSGRIGLRVPTPRGIELAVEGDWIVRSAAGELSIERGVPADERGGQL